MATIKKAKEALKGRAAQLKRLEEKALGQTKPKAKAKAKKKATSTTKFKSIDQLRKEALAKRKAKKS